MRWLPLAAASSAAAAAALAWTRRGDIGGMDELDRAVTPDEQTMPAPRSRHGTCPRPRGPLGKRLTQSTSDRHGTVVQSPAELLAQARRVDVAITLEELTAARLAASEYFYGTRCELEAIVDAEVNRARKRGLTLTEHLTSGGTYGRQGGRGNGGKKRKAATKRDPFQRQLRAARAIVTTGQGRGISRGAVRFFDPMAQLDANQKWLRGEIDRRHCHPLVILERWSFDRYWAKRKGSCQLDPKRGGRDRLEWVGDITGIDPLRLLLMRPATSEHQKRYDAARALLTRHLPKVPS